LTEKTPTPTFTDQLILSTLGIRSAGTLGDVLILGGPSLLGGINLFAFDTETCEYLGSSNLTEYDNIRKWLVVDGILYTTVGNTPGGGTPGQGSVLRWIGDRDDPFAFEVVGTLDGQGAELAYHEGHLFVSTWPSLTGDSPTLAGLYMSPEIPDGGLTSEHNNPDPKEPWPWEKVWQVNQYEPDPVTAATYGGGAIASFDGHLYWGTMHVPFLSMVAHSRVYYERLGRTPTEEELLKAVLGTYRAISIFRGCGFGDKEEEPRIELLYGMRRLPVYTGTEWVLESNNMESRPRWGLSGFGNFFNNYTWTMAVYDNQLFVGTMDWSYLFHEVLDTLLESQIGYVPMQMPRFPTRFYGADLWRFRSSNRRAVPERIAGVGNYTSYGIRTMVSDDALYLGMANPMNLLTDSEDGMPNGGWELIRLKSRRH
jgi:hypothetical protein